jgi:peptide/nickel transport system ATP-binding protein
VVETGPSGRSFQHPYSKALAAAFPTVGDPGSRLAPKGLGGDPPDPQQLPSGCVFHPRCPVALDSCSTVEIDLRPAGDRRTAACVLVGEG